MAIKVSPGSKLQVLDRRTSKLKKEKQEKRNTRSCQKHLQFKFWKDDGDNAYFSDVKQHSIWDNSGKIALKNSIAVTCRQRTMKVKMSVKDRANELLNMMELMVSVLQQLKIDESRLPLEADEMTKDLRHMEFELRDIAESVYRKLVENNLGPLLAPYTSGHFPDHPIYNGYSPKTVRTMIVMQLYALQSCIGDIYHVLKNDLLDVLHGIKFRA
eukprot:gene4867-21194_t